MSEIESGTSMELFGVRLPCTSKRDVAKSYQKKKKIHCTQNRQVTHRFTNRLKLINLS